MKVTIVLEGGGLDLEPLREIMDAIDIEQERIMSAWLDIPEEMVPNSVKTEMHQTAVHLSQPILDAVKCILVPGVEQVPIIQYIRNKINGFGIPYLNITGLVILPTRIELILER